MACPLPKTKVNKAISRTHTHYSQTLALPCLHSITHFQRLKRGRMHACTALESNSAQGVLDLWWGKKKAWDYCCCYRCCTPTEAWQFWHPEWWGEPFFRLTGWYERLEEFRVLILKQWVAIALISLVFWFLPLTLHDFSKIFWLFPHGSTSHAMLRESMQSPFLDMTSTCCLYTIRYIKISSS